MLTAEVESRLGGKFLKAIFITCAIGGATLLWSGYGSEAPKSNDDVTMPDEVGSRADFSGEVVGHAENNFDLIEFIASGWVVDSEGNGISHARVSVEYPPKDSFSVLTEEDGEFAIGPFAAANLVELEVSAEGYISNHVPIESDEPDVLVTLLRTGRLEGIAIDSKSSSPIDQFTVSLFVDGNINFLKIPDTRAVFHEPNGNFEITDLEHNRMDLFARAVGYQPVILNTIVVSDITERVELRFDKARSVFGRVLNANSGEAISGVEVYVQNSKPSIEHPRRFSYPGQSTKTSADGTFSLDEAPTGGVTLYVRIRDFVSKRVEVGEYDDGDIEILLAPAGSVSGRLIGIDGSSPSVGSIVLLNSETGNSFRGRISEEGGFHVKNLAPGYYVLNGRSKAGRSSEIEFTLGDAENIEGLQLQILPGNELTGRVSGLMTGEKIVGVGAIGPGDLSVASKTDAAGNYTLRGLPTGTFKIVATTSEGRSLSRFVDLQATTAAYLDFNFDGTARIYGRITRDGIPIRRTHISMIPVDQDQPIGGTITSEDGFYSIRGLADRKYVFSVNGEGKRYITLSGSTQLDVDL